LLTEAIVDEEQLDKVSDELLGLEGMDTHLAAQLAKQGITDRDGLADLAVDELVDMTGMEEAQATALITVARAHWFAEQA
jgi:N utilization substance protein A